MTLKRLLIAPLLVSLAVFLYFSADMIRSFRQLMAMLPITPALLLTVALAVILQLIGHIIRAQKTALLFGKIKQSSVRFQFRALSVGYLFNTILPLRLGELIRARIISGAMTISFSYALVLIVFERLIDAMILGAVGLLLILTFVKEGQSILIIYASTLLTLGALLLTGILLLMHQNRRVLRLWHQITGLLNEDLKNSYRFKVWSVIYGLQQTLKTPTIRRYLSLTVISWLFYGASLLVIVQYLLGSYFPGSKAALTIAPYYGMAVPSGPANLGVFSNVMNQFSQFLHMRSGSMLTLNLMVWAVLVLPVAAIGIILLFGKTRETLWQTRPKQVSRQSLEHKLYRQEDISQDMKQFLDKYFSGNSLSRIVHQLELSEGFRLVKYFKGGSDAITILALQKGDEVVKKIIPLEFEGRLKAQYDWLEQRNGTPGIVKVLAEEQAGQYYAIDLEYDPNNEMFYEFLHRNPIGRSTKVMDAVWASLFARVYGDIAELDVYPKERQAYIDKHIFGCLTQASAVDPELVKAAMPEKLIINGRPYDNLHQVMNNIRRHPRAWKDIASYRRSDTVHGDVIVDNLLVSSKTGDVLIIDPAPDGNIINGPVFDFGKNMQSLYCGYETLLRDEDKVFLTGGNRIDYRDLASDKYRQLSDYVRQELAPKYLNESEQHAMLFHAAALYIRRLKHQVYYTPANVLKFYAVGVKTLNEFLAQYEELPRS
jgi:hypothetical protein